MRDLLEQAKAMAARMEAIKEELAARTVEASVGGGMVRVVATGAQRIVSVHLDREVVDPGDVEMLQDLITAAVNEALRKAQDMATGEMQKLTGGISIPGL
ncbi:MAG: YbaB/EbfC family nucleoid-associated protein [Candidatus Schekmanbacteria bacterium]|nr:YbaB/EbfC family nucleoid-associated protein [Candidatus Schekmanbacteria bacterium]